MTDAIEPAANVNSEQAGEIFALAKAIIPRRGFDFRDPDSMAPIAASSLLLDLISPPVTAATFFPEPAPLLTAPAKGRRVKYEVLARYLDEPLTEEKFVALIGKWTKVPGWLTGVIERDLLSIR